MSAFADTSALVKFYVPEHGHDRVRALNAVVVSQIASVEVPSAIWRKHRVGGLTATGARRLLSAFEADYHGTPKRAPRFEVIPVSQLIFDVAARLTGVHGLRGFDAVQLATAQLAASADPECRTFAAFDKRLCEAAIGEGFHLLPEA
ncbi:type II toxin-antitoxin system VapC family toxin [Amycolatopsis anabasis]|uniref:type II toxin-antitoxin system VapC family toxin n=1 Tax=Amycolatopsis anabasis TaxID=1840409 RepID=UPI00131A6F6A|nr:type II toxin-antitoxin system VapC family toxin [Amycolatopsis anabasis]